MDDSVRREWEANLPALISRLQQTPPGKFTLRDGGDARIEPATTDDAEIVHSITSQAFAEFRGILDPPNGSDAESAEDVRCHMTKGGVVLAYVLEKPVGSVRLTIYPEYLYVGRVGVVPEERGRGICAGMMQYVEQIAARLQLPEIRLGTREKLKNNVALYVKLGYEIVGVQAHPRGPDRVVLFRKSIALTVPAHGS